MPYWVFLAALVSLLALSPGNSRAAERHEVTAVFEVWVAGNSVGDEVVILDKDDVLVPMKALRSGGLRSLSNCARPVRDVEYCSLRAARPKLSFQLDENELVLKIEAPPAAFGRSKVDLGSAAPPGVWYSEETSAFLNYAPRLTDGKFDGFAEAGASIGSGRIVTSGNYDTVHGPVRLLSSVEWDDRKSLRQGVLGDTYVTTDSLGGSVLIGGATLRRQFALDPYLVRIPRLGYQANIASPSTIDVYVNGNLVRRVPVSPGEVNLANIAPMTGAGSVRYVIHDAMGDSRSVSESYYAPTQVLARGVTEYTYSVGLVRNYLGTRSFSYGDPAAIGFHRLGLTDQLTVGSRAEATLHTISAGTSLALATRAGEFELGFGGSGSRETGVVRTGTASLFGYSYRANRISVRTAVKLTSRYYANTGLSPFALRNLIEESTSGSIALGARTNVASQISFASSTQTGVSVRFTGVVNSQIGNDLSVQVIASRTVYDTGAKDSEIFANLVYSLPERHTATLTKGFSQGVSQQTFGVSRALSGPTGISYQGSVTQAGEATNGSAAVQAQSLFGRMSGSVIRQDGQTHTLVEGAGTIIFAPDSGIYVSQPLQAFAVVEVPGIEGVRVYLNNTEIGRTDGEGKLFVPNLQPYYSNELSIDPADLPLGTEVDGETVRLAPPSRGGATVIFNLRKLRLVRGVLTTWKDGQRVPLKYGVVTLTSHSAEKESPIGPDGQFELDGAETGIWRGVASSPSFGRCTVEVDVAGDVLVRDVGELDCQPIGEGNPSP
jgi:outer membrane usher protein